MTRVCYFKETGEQPFRRCPFCKPPTAPKEENPSLREASSAIMSQERMEPQEYLDRLSCQQHAIGSRDPLPRLKRMRKSSMREIPYTFHTELENGVFKASTDGNVPVPDHSELKCT